MPYAIVADVEALNRGRKLGVGSNPTTDDVGLFLELTAGEIDSILLNRGYSLPIATTSEGATRLLRMINARGALLLTEDASPTPSANVDRLRKEWEADLEKLGEATFSLDAPLSVERTRPRGPGLTSPKPGTLESEPFFTRHQIF